MILVLAQCSQRFAVVSPQHQVGLALDADRAGQAAAALSAQHLDRMETRLYRLIRWLQARSPTKVRFRVFMRTVNGGVAR